jgi:hypothetical protein
MPTTAPANDPPMRENHDCRVVSENVSDMQPSGRTRDDDVSR